MAPVNRFTATQGLSWINRVLGGQCRLPQDILLLMMCLLDHRHVATNRSFPSVATISLETTLAEIEVTRALKSAEELSIIYARGFMVSGTVTWEINYPHKPPWEQLHLRHSVTSRIRQLGLTDRQQLLAEAAVRVGYDWITGEIVTTRRELRQELPHWSDMKIYDTLKELSRMGLMPTIRKGHGRKPALRLLNFPVSTESSGVSDPGSRGVPGSETPEVVRVPGSQTPEVVRVPGSETPEVVRVPGSQTPELRRTPYIEPGNEPGIEPEQHARTPQRARENFAAASSVMRQNLEVSGGSAAVPEALELCEDVYDLDPARWRDVTEPEDLQTVARLLTQACGDLVERSDVRARVVEWSTDHLDRLNAVNLGAFLSSAVKAMGKGSVSAVRRPVRSEIDFSTEEGAREYYRLGVESGRRCGRCMKIFNERLDPCVCPD